MVNNANIQKAYLPIFLCLLFTLLMVSCDPCAWFRELVIKERSLPDGKMEEYYEEQVLKVWIEKDCTGDEYQYLYSIASGYLPYGMELNGSFISGIPMAHGRFKFSIEVTVYGFDTETGLPAFSDTAVSREFTWIVYR